MTVSVSDPGSGQFRQTVQVARDILPIVIAGTIAFWIINTWLDDSIAPQPFLLGVTTGLILYPTCLHIHH